MARKKKVDLHARTCHCVELANETLGLRNTKVREAITFGERTGSRIVVATDKVDPGVRGNPVVLMATFCPFCGVKTGD